MKRIGLITIMLVMALAFTAPAGAVTADVAERGDALIFPMYYLNADNYFTIRNNSNEFVQTHIRFRTGVASREVRDFDVVLSPWDEVTMSVQPVVDSVTGATVNGRIVSTDKSFRYNPLTEDYNATTGFSTQFSATVLQESQANLTKAEYDYEIQFGYVEVFGEAVLVGLNETVANALVAAGRPINAWQWYQWNEVIGVPRQPNAPTGIPIYSANPAAFAEQPYGIQRRAVTNLGGVGTGVNVPAVGEYSLADCPNVLTGVQYYKNPNGGGVAMDAIALQNFRTDRPIASATVRSSHRDLDNYPKLTYAGYTGPTHTGVILHDSNFVGRTMEAMDYRYSITEIGLPFYQRTMYWATTFGPTWLDGDDDDATPLSATEPGEHYYEYVKIPAVENLGHTNPEVNSLDEVETALKNMNYAGTIGGTTHYFNNKDLYTALLLTWPTKHLHFPEDTLAVCSNIQTGLNAHTYVEWMWRGWNTAAVLVEGAMKGYRNAAGVQVATGSKQTCVAVNPTIFDTEEHGMAAPEVAGNMSPVLVQQITVRPELCFELSFAAVDMFGVPYEEGWIGILPSPGSYMGTWTWSQSFCGLALTVDKKSGKLTFANQLK